MTPEQFRDLRESRNQTREDLGKILGASASAIVQWERGTRTIPLWAIEKMFRSVDVSIPIEDLALLMDTAQAEKKDFAAYLTGIIREHLRSKRAPYLDISNVAEEGNGTYAAEKPTAASPAKGASKGAGDTGAGKK